MNRLNALQTRHFSFFDTDCPSHALTFLLASRACCSSPSYLNQINTQSTLLAGCATGMLASGELNAMEDDGMHDGAGIFTMPLNGLYIMSTTVCLASSLWVIYTAMNLINLSIHSTLCKPSAAAQPHTGLL